LPGPFWMSDYAREETSCPFSEKLCLECEYAERLALTGLPVDCRRGHIDKVRTLWVYMFKDYKR